ncbi:Fic family protein [Mycolicibacillus trivialis]|uniref:Death-on-curing protein n=1 Tax=Mycolicibacillus trivialis TaxID=1798 RepID=A0A1X2EHR0_9MYCO|nr:Fic family protein [Mycolicibacillus trivialis]ORX02430.1 death-on-curing protein [Mycolicibacillus trivialis]
MIDLPTRDEILFAAECACGFRPLVRDPGLFESCLMRPAATVFGTDAYPAVWDKAAALLHSLTTTQSLADGNKRTGWAACWLLLGLNGHRLSANLDVDAAEGFMLDIAANKLSWEQIAARLPEFAQR